MKGSDPDFDASFTAELSFYIEEADCCGVAVGLTSSDKCFEKPTQSRLIPGLNLSL